MRRAFCLALCLVLASAVVQAAGGEKGDVELGIFGGYSLLDEYEGSRFDFRRRLISDNDLNPDDDYLFGFRIGYFLTSNWSLEGSFQRVSTEANFDTCVAKPCPGTRETASTADADLDSFRVNLLYNWREGEGIRPFLAVGAGAEGTDIDGVIDEDDLGLNAGLGVRFFLGRGFQVRVESRYMFTEVSDPVDGSQSNLEAQVGLSWSFGTASPDTDGDGIKDRKDRCDSTSQGARVDARGCPLDADGDGVPDGIDQCSNTPAGVEVGDRGCPPDDDDDGVDQEDDSPLQ